MMKFTLNKFSINLIDRSLKEIEHRAGNFIKIISLTYLTVKIFKKSNIISETNICCPLYSE